MTKELIDAAFSKAQMTAFCEEPGTFTPREAFEAGAAWQAEQTTAQVAGMARAVDTDYAQLYQEQLEANKQLGIRINELADEIHCAERALEAHLVKFPSAKTDFDCLGDMIDELARRMATAASAGQPVAYGVMARVDGEDCLQYPVRLARSEAQRDAESYEAGSIVWVVELYLPGAGVADIKRMDYLEQLTTYAVAELAMDARNHYAGDLRAAIDKRMERET